MKLSQRSFRQIVLLGVLAWVSTLALALPSPKDISAAVAQGKLADAENMLREVIAEKPGSAKAHYEMAEVLAREGRPTEALSEMEKAKGIDPTLHFAQSPDKFNEVLADIHKAIAASSPPHAVSSAGTSVAHAPSPSQAGNPSASANVPWGLVLLLVGGVVVWVLWRQRPASLTPTPVAMPTPTPQTPQGFGAAYNPGGPVYAPSSGVGSGVAGAVVGGLAGVAAGYALSKAMEGHAQPSVRHSDDDGFVPINPSGAPADANANFGSFDPGSGGNDWDDAPSASDDDSW